MAGTLFVVATPIGNLEDITLRALRVLRAAKLIAAEDTRRTARLLAHHAIATPTLSFHEHNTRSRIPRLLARLEAGDHIALVTDAGTPGVSDPGVELVRACVERGMTVDAVPGPSAPLVAAIASGFSLEPLTMFGFVPSRAKDRTIWLHRVAAIENTFTFFEAPHRIRRTLTEATNVLVDRPITVARELTKIHQEFLRGESISAIIGQVTDIRGEFTIVIGPSRAPGAQTPVISETEIANEFGRTTYSVRGGRRKAVAALAKKYGRSPREVYAIIERSKNLVI